MISDQIKFNKNYNALSIKCFACEQKGHLANECPLIHYIPNFEKIVKIYTYNPEQKNRKTAFRNPAKSSNALSAKFDNNKAFLRFQRLLRQLYVMEYETFIEKSRDFSQSDDEFNKGNEISPIEILSSASGFNVSTLKTQKNEKIPFKLKLFESNKTKENSFFNEENEENSKENSKEYSKEKSKENSRKNSWEKSLKMSTNSRKNSKEKSSEKSRENGIFIEESSNDTNNSLRKYEDLTIEVGKNSFRSNKKKKFSRLNAIIEINSMNNSSSPEKQQKNEEKNFEENFLKNNENSFEMPEININENLLRKDDDFLYEKPMDFFEKNTDFLNDNFLEKNTEKFINSDQNLLEKNTEKLDEFSNFFENSSKTDKVSQQKNLINHRENHKPPSLDSFEFSHNTPFNSKEIPSIHTPPSLKGVRKNSGFLTRKKSKPKSEIPSKSPLLFNSELIKKKNVEEFLNSPLLKLPIYNVENRFFTNKSKNLEKVPLKEKKITIINENEEIQEKIKYFIEENLEFDRVSNFKNYHPENNVKNIIKKMHKTRKPLSFEDFFHIKPKNRHFTKNFNHYFHKTETSSLLNKNLRKRSQVFPLVSSPSSPLKRSGDRFNQQNQQKMPEKRPSSIFSLNSRNKNFFLHEPNETTFYDVVYEVLTNLELRKKLVMEKVKSKKKKTEMKMKKK